VSRAASKLPLSEIEWQVAVDVANLLLALSLGVKYGLVDERQKINVDRCQLVLARGRKKGFHPRTPGPAGPLPT